LFHSVSQAYDVEIHSCFAKVRHPESDGEFRTS
jgi:hypothetical protein